MIEINREELAWAAGLWDGEGNARVMDYPKRYMFYPMLQMAQTDRRVLDRFQKAVGGLGNKIGGPYQSNQPNKTPWFRWYTNNFEQAQAVMAMLYQFLSPVKQEQCLQMLKDYNEGYKHSKYAKPIKIWRAID